MQRQWKAGTHREKKEDNAVETVSVFLFFFDVFKNRGKFLTFTTLKTPYHCGVKYEELLRFGILGAFCQHILVVGAGRAPNV